MIKKWKINSVLETRLSSSCKTASNILSFKTSLWKKQRTRLKDRPSSSEPSKVRKEYFNRRSRSSINRKRKGEIWKALWLANVLTFLWIYRLISKILISTLKDSKPPQELHKNQKMCSIIRSVHWERSFHRPLQQIGRSKISKND